MLTQDKITEIYCIADDFCKEFAQEFEKLKMLPDDGRKQKQYEKSPDEFLRQNFTS